MPDVPTDLDSTDPDSAETPDTGLVAPMDPEASTAPPAGTAGDHGKGVTPASVASPTVASSSREDAAAVAPAGPAPASTPGGVPGGAMSPAGGAGSGSRAPVHSKPLGPPPTPKPAAASAQPTARTGPPARPEPPDRVEPPGVAALAAVPVSAARAARDAVAAASTAEARRKDPLPLARRIAAALNAPNGGGASDFGFFWVTAITRDGDIVVANSYGLAYIPEGVYLPEPVHMASADETIPASERARWATYPMVAVQGWAVHHDTTLRAVIATEEQFADSDPGAAKVVLQPDDIPESGEMAGRSRLEVVDPEAAEQLSDTTDPNLAGLLPPPQARHDPPAEQRKTDDAKDPDRAVKLKKLVSERVDIDSLIAMVPKESADATPSADRRAALWFDVIKPMTSKADARAAAHLRAFHTYAAHTQGIAVATAHEAVEPTAQRTAIADWLYWKYLTELLEAAVTGLN